MAHDPSHAERPVALAATPATVPGARTGAAPASVRLPRLGAVRLPRLGLASRPAAGKLALGVLIAGTFAIVAYASAGQGVLVPRSYLGFPPWESGPWHLIFRWLPINQYALNIGLSIVLLALLPAYALAIAAVRTLTMRAIVIAIVALHAILLFSPPLQLTDLFNYLGYARLGALHHLNPYTHVIADEIHDPVFRFSSWHNLHSPYGPLFTALTYPLGLVWLPVAYWVMKVATMVASLGLVALVWQCARRLGRDPRYALVLLVFNPIYVIYAMGGFHNDFFMLVPALGAVALLLERRDRSAGAVLMLAVAVKFTAVLLLPFLLYAARQRRRQRDVVIGSAAAAIPLAALSLALFGFSLPDLKDQSILLTDFSIPQLFGLLIGIGGGTAGLLKAANVALVVLVAWLLRSLSRRRGDWLVGAGWATVALIASLAWLMPWYVIWLLPLAGLGSSLRLRRTALALTLFLVVTFLPLTGIVLFEHGLNPMNTSVGRASTQLQIRLEG